MASASRLLRAMREAGMLEVIGATRRHRPGRMMLDLAAAFRHSSGLIGRASEVVADAARRFGHTGYLSLRDGREVTAIADFEGTNSLRVVSNIGRRLPAHLSATGRSLLARLPDAQVAALYAGRPEAGSAARGTGPGARAGLCRLASGNHPRRRRHRRRRRRSRHRRNRQPVPGVSRTRWSPLRNATP